MIVAGSGKTFSVTLTVTDRASAWRVVIQRMPASPPDFPDAGTYDHNTASPFYGTYLHIQANLPTRADDLTKGFEATPANFLQEWDPDGMEVFPPKCSNVTLVGGEGAYSVSWLEVPLDTIGYVARPRRLLRYVDSRAARPFTVPAGHTGIASLNGSVTLQNVSDGVALVLDSAGASHILSGTQIGTLTGGDAMQVYTSFLQ